MDFLIGRQALLQLNLLGSYVRFEGLDALSVALGEMELD